MEKQKKCIECETELAPSENICPKCGAEQPISWLVWVVYAMLGLFVIGAIYRLIAT